MEDFMREGTDLDEQEVKKVINRFISETGKRVSNMIPDVKALNRLFSNSPIVPMLPLVPHRMPRKRRGLAKGLADDPAQVIDQLWNQFKESGSPFGNYFNGVSPKSIPVKIYLSLFETDERFSDPDIRAFFKVDWSDIKKSLGDFFKWIGMRRDEKGSMAHYVSEENSSDPLAERVSHMIILIFLGYMYYVSRAIANLGQDNDLIAFWTDLSIEERQGSVEELTRSV